MIETTCFENSELIDLMGEKPKTVKDVSTDSRNITSDDLFIALRGEKFNGEDFVDDLIKKGIKYFVVREDFSKDKIKNYLSKKPHLCFYLVSDTLQFFQEAARFFLLSWRLNKKIRKVFGITGSNGKTTTKDMFYHFMSGIYPKQVLATQGNFNNHIGVPKTIFRLTEDFDYLILEMGMNHQGELDQLLYIAPIDGAIITNIGTAHIEHLKTKENIFKEKRKLFDFVNDHESSIGPVILNKDDEYLAKLKSKKALFFSSKEKSKDCYFYDLNKNQVILEKQNLKIKLTNNEITGGHNFQNLISSFLLTLEISKTNPEVLAELAKSFKPSKNRSYWLKEKGKEVFLDAYNANPESMKASLTGFHEHLLAQSIDLNDALFILGDMNELGEMKEAGHQEIGLYLNELQAKNVVFIGVNADFYQKGFHEGGVSFETREEFLASQYWKDSKLQFKYFFVKASNSLALEKLIDNL